MIRLDGEWLDHDDPRVNDMWRERLRFFEAERSLAQCLEIMPAETALLIEAAASYPEASPGCEAARRAYNALRDLG